nr:hypothetical protein [Tanacetum cinerariifolium]
PRKALASSKSRKSLSPNGVSVGEVVETIGSSEGMGLPLALDIDALTGETTGSDTGFSDWVTGGWRCAVLYEPGVCTWFLVTSVPCLTTLDEVGIVGSVPDPEDEAMLELINLDIISIKLANWSLVSRRLINLGSMKLGLVEIRLIEINTSVLSKTAPPIEMVLIILNERESGRLDLICNHLRTETGVSLVIIGCYGL